MKVTQSCPTLCDPMDHTVQGILQARILEWVAIPISGVSSQPRDQTRCPALQADSLPVEPPGKPKSTGVGSLSLLQQIFPTQELNRGLLHFRWILYQLSYQGSPMWETWVWSLSWEDSWRRDRLPTQVFWPGEYHGLYSPCGRKESGTTEPERLSLLFAWFSSCH